MDVRLVRLSSCHVNVCSVARRRRAQHPLPRGEEWAHGSSARRKAPADASYVEYRRPHGAAEALRQSTITFATRGNNVRFMQRIVRVYQTTRGATVLYSTSPMLRASRLLTYVNAQRSQRGLQCRARIFNLQSHLQFEQHYMKVQTEDAWQAFVRRESLRHGARAPQIAGGAGR